MNDSYLEYIGKVNGWFEKKFADVYRRSNPRHRAKLLPFTAAIYRRWYYSALVENTLLTPANIVESLNRAHDRPPDAASAAAARSGGRYSGLRWDMIDYTLTRHPILADLRKLLDFCGPAMELDEAGCFTVEQAVRLSEGLSMRDPHYASYLLAITQMLNLVTKIPSIYANRAQTAKDAKTRLAGPVETLFGEITDASVKMAAEALMEYIPLPEPVYTEPFIRSLLRRPMETDDILQRVYDVLGFGPDGTPDPGYGESDELDAAFFSGAFMIGILLDKYFFTPFGHYLKLIRPLYDEPFEFDAEIKYFLETGFEYEDLYLAYFAPCARYHFTELGLAYFNIKPTPHNRVNIKQRLPFTLLEDELFSAGKPPDPLFANARRFAPEPCDQGQVYAIKIKSLQNPGLWINVEMTADTTLHRLYQEAAKHFDLGCGDDYSFFHDSTENPFAEYASPVKKKRAKKTAGITLDALDFQHKEQLILTANVRHAVSYKGHPPRKQPASAARLEITVMQTKTRERGRPYPSVTRVSKGLLDKLGAGD